MFFVKRHLVLLLTSFVLATTLLVIALSPSGKHHVAPGGMVYTSMRIAYPTVAVSEDQLSTWSALWDDRAVAIVGTELKPQKDVAAKIREVAATSCSKLYPTPSAYAQPDDKVVGASSGLALALSACGAVPSGLVVATGEVDTGGTVLSVSGVYYKVTGVRESGVVPVAFVVPAGQGSQVLAAWPDFPGKVFEVATLLEALHVTKSV